MSLFLTVTVNPVAGMGDVGIKTLNTGSCAAALIAAEAGAYVRTATTPDGAGFVVAAAPGLGAAFEGALERCGVVSR